MDGIIVAGSCIEVHWPKISRERMQFAFLQDIRKLSLNGQNTVLQLPILWFRL